MFTRLHAQVHEIRLDLHSRWLRRQERARALSLARLTVGRTFAGSHLDSAAAHRTRTLRERLAEFYRERTRDTETDSGTPADSR